LHGIFSQEHTLPVSKTFGNPHFSHHGLLIKLRFCQQDPQILRLSCTSTPHSKQRGGKIIWVIIFKTLVRLDRMTDTFLFDRKRLKTLQQKAVAVYGQYDFLQQQAALRVVDQIADLQTFFPLAATVGDYQAILATTLQQHNRIETVYSSHFWQQEKTDFVCAEDFLPFAPQSLDLLASCGSLQSVNDVVGHLIQARQALRPDGLYICAFWGGETLKELKECLHAAEIELNGGVSPRFSPSIFVKDAGMLLQRAGFALPVVTQETLTITYPDIFAFIKDLRGMAATNILTKQNKKIPSKALFLKAEQLYQERYSTTDNRLNATAELIIMAGFAPAATQQQPLKRGTGKISLGDVLQ
jgi:SAM-dependent methyltransferase